MSSEFGKGEGGESGVSIFSACLCIRTAVQMCVLLLLLLRGEAVVSLGSKFTIPAGGACQECSLIAYLKTMTDLSVILVAPFRIG